jgi:two-component sensor histidine kinase
VSLLPTLRASLPGDQRAPWAVRQSIRCLEDFVQPHVLEDAHLLVTELVTNAVRHAALRDDQSIEIEACPSGRALRVAVTNPGTAELAHRLPQPVYSGRGLLLVAKIASRWGVETGARTAIWFEIDLEPGERRIAN